MKNEKSINDTALVKGDYFSLKDVYIDKKCIEIIPEAFASKYNLIPILIKDRKIKVAMENPLDIFAIQDISTLSGCEVEVVMSSKEEIIRAIEKHYSSEYIKNAAQEIMKEQRAINSNIFSIVEKDSIKIAPAVRIVDRIIKKAVESRASDIHFEPFEKYFRIRYRIDGDLSELESLPIESYNSIVTRIKILSSINTAEKRIPQDGKIYIQVDRNNIDCRVSTLPTIYGEKIVIRILRKEVFLINKEKIGLSREELLVLNKMTKISHGLILVTGPTGSGKTTTLYSILNDFKASNANIVTIEDPVEFDIEGINQVNVNSAIGLSFGAGLRAILRQDPDVIMIGEIRDAETAQIAIRAAITGHIVLSTIHTNDSASAVMRLVDMGIEPYLVSNAISGVLSQRLVKKICPYCIEEYESDKLEMEMLGHNINSVLKLYKGRTCQRCNYTGYLGRTGVFELMEITRNHREFMSNNYSIREIKNLSIKNGMITLKQSCLNLVLNGTTTIDEFIKIAYEED